MHLETANPFRSFGEFLLKISQTIPVLREYLNLGLDCCVFAYACFLETKGSLCYSRFSFWNERLREKCPMKLGFKKPDF